MDNMERVDLNLQEIISATPGNLLNAEKAILHQSKPQPFSEFVYDSRKAIQDCVFICIPGARVDGHDFIDTVVQSGSKLVIGQDSKKLKTAAEKYPNIFFYEVADVLTALQNIAKFYRRKFSIPTIGLSGSSGKTTTKDLLGAILKHAGPALVTEGTLNNHWGVPQTVLCLRRSHRVAVFEMGISDFHELENLTSISQPEIGYLTTIGSAHLEKLGSLDGVLKAKRELFDWIAAHSAERTLIFNIDNPHLEKLHAEFVSRKTLGLRLITISQNKAHADVRLTKKQPLGLEHRYGWAYTFETPWGTIQGTLPLPGAHNLANAMAGATLALATGKTAIKDVVAGLEQSQVSKMRSDLFRTQNGAVIYNDSYNANPTSVSALFEAAQEIRKNTAAGLSKTIAVVGDMLELGQNADELHRQMGRLAAQDGVDVLFATGNFARFWVEGFKEQKRLSGGSAALAFPTQEKLIEALSDEVRGRPTETLVLVKGSRGAKMDLIVDYIRKTY